MGVSTDPLRTIALSKCKRLNPDNSAVSFRRIKVAMKRADPFPGHVRGNAARAHEAPPIEVKSHTWFTFHGLSAFICMFFFFFPSSRPGRRRPCEPVLPRPLSNAEELAGCGVIARSEILSLINEAEFWMFPSNTKRGQF